MAQPPLRFHPDLMGSHAHRVKRGGFYTFLLEVYLTRVQRIKTDTTHETWLNIAPVKNGGGFGFLQAHNHHTRGFPLWGGTFDSVAEPGAPARAGEAAGALLTSLAMVVMKAGGLAVAMRERACRAERAESAAGLRGSPIVMLNGHQTKRGERKGALEI